MMTQDLKTPWKIAVGAILALAMSFIDQTAVNVALPSIQAQLQLSTNGLHWVVNAYLLTLAMFLVLGGKWGDRFGNRRIYLAGVGLFALFSWLCALAPNGTALIVSRAFQGVGAALMMPNCSAIIMNAFPDNQRGKVMGILLSFTSVFLIVGPLLGGLASQYVSWRAIFWINLPVAAVSIIMMLRYAPKGHAHRQPIDWFGFGLCAAWVFALVFGLMQSVDYGWRSPIIIGSLMAGVIIFIVFVGYEWRHKNPFIELDLFRNKVFTTAALLYSGTQMVFIIQVFMPVYTQHVLGFSPASAGALAVPALLPMMLISPFAGKMRDRYGPRLPMQIGFGLLTAGNVWLVLSFWTKSIFIIFPGMMSFASAAPFIFGNANATALSVISPKKRGIAAGLTICCRQLGGTMSMAILGTLIVSVSLHYGGILSVEMKQQAYVNAITACAMVTSVFSAICLYFTKNIPASLTEGHNLRGVNQIKTIATK